MLAERESGAGPRLIHALRVALALLIGAAGALAATPPAGAVDADAPVHLAVVVPIVVPPEKSGLIDAEALTRYTSPFGVLTRQLDAVAGRDVTLAIDPRIITSVRLLGSEAPPTATAWLRRLETTPHESFLLPYGDADVSLATQAGSTTVPAPTSLDFAIVPELFPAPEPSPEPSPTATADPAVTVPTTESLLAWPNGHQGLLWPADDRVVAADLPMFAASGYTSVLLTSDNVGSRTSAHADLGDLNAVIADSATSLALRDAAGTDAQSAPAMTALVDAISTAANDQSGAAASIVATLGRSVLLSDTRLPAVLDALDADVRIELVPLSAVLTGEPAPGTLVDSPHDAAAVAIARQMVGLDAEVAAFSSIAARPELLSGEHRLALLATLDTGWAANPAGWELAAEEFAVASRVILDSVQIVDSSDVNFFTDRSSIQVPLRNDLDQPVTVYLTVTAQRPLLDIVDDRVEITLEPNSVRNAPVPVQSISNGTVRLTMTLQGPGGQKIGSTAGLTVNVQAGWEGPIVVVLAVIVVLVFAGGLARNIARRRRESA